MFFFDKIKNSDRKTWVKKVKDEVLKNKITILQGLRRIGKTLIMQTVANTESFNDYKKEMFDAMEFGQNNDQKALALLKKFKNNINNQYLLLVDEFQELKDWNKFFWNIHKLKNVKLIATGSISANIDMVQETEGGRYVYIDITPLSFIEYKIINRDYLIGNNNDDVFYKYATMGSYPGQEFSENINAYKRQVTHNIIEKIKNYNLLERSGIKDSQNVTSILLYIIENIGNTMSINSISHKLQINNRTTNKIINYLKTTFIIYEINNDISSKGKAAAFNRKFYLTDHTFYLYIHQNEYKKVNPKYRSFLFENIVINQLKSTYERQEVDIRFLLSKAKNKSVDIDLVIKKNGKKKYFEIKDSINIESLTKDQKHFANKDNLNVIYLGKTKKIDNKQYINTIDFFKEIKKWIQDN